LTVLFGGLCFDFGPTIAVWRTSYKVMDANGLLVQDHDKALIFAFVLAAPILLSPLLGITNSFTLQREKNY